MADVIRFGEAEVPKFIAWVERNWPGSGIHAWGVRQGAIGCFQGEWVVAFSWNCDYMMDGKKTVHFIGSTAPGYTVDEYVTAAKNIQRHLLEDGYDVVKGHVRRIDPYQSHRLAPMVFGPPDYEDEIHLGYSITREKWPAVWGEPF